MKIQLRDYQSHAFDQARELIRQGKRRILIVAPTGAGKTVLASALMEMTREKGNRATFVVDRLSLIDQTSAVFDRYGLEHGVVQGNHFRFRAYEPIQLCSVQTLAKRQWPDSQVDVFDEAHVLHACHKHRMQADSIVIGLTATPFARGLGKYFDAVINVTTTRKLIEDGWLSSYRIFSCAEPDMTGVKVKSTGEWDDKQASSKALEIVGDVVAEYVKHGEGRKFICSAVDTAHVEELARQFTGAGIQVATYTYKDRTDDRADTTREFRKPDSVIRGLITVTAASRGFDVPDVSCLDANTEVLTPQGWRGMWDAFREVVAFDTGTGALSTEQVEARVMKPRVGEMVCIKGGQFDVRVTDDHRMVAGTTGALTKWRVMSAGEVASLPRFRLPASGNALPTSGVDLTDDELRFVAWFITDGGWVRNRAQNRVQIAQSKPDMVIRIRELLERLGYRYGEYVYPNQRGYAARHAMPLHRFHIPIGVRGDARGHGFHAVAEYLDKELSPKLLSMDDRQFRVFWEELLHGDGNGDTRRKPQLCIGHQGLLANLQALAVMRGHATNATSAVTCKNGDPFWLMSWDDRKHREVKAKNGTVKTERSSGESVWCVQNRLGTLVIRRNGRVSIVGNCIIMARPLRKSLAEHIQLFGRGLRIASGKSDCLVLDHAGNCIAKGALVLTERGNIPIEDVSKNDRIWDGYEFVRHGGTVCKGRKPTVTYCGLTATRDHRVKTAWGWRTLGWCAEKQIAIITTGIGRQAIRERDGYFSIGGVAWRTSESKAARIVRVRRVWLSVNHCARQFAARTYAWLSRMQSASQVPEVAVCAMPVDATAMQFCSGVGIRELWRSRDPLRVRFPIRMRALDCAESWGGRIAPEDGLGSNRQRWKLRARQSSMGFPAPEFIESTHDEMGGADAQFQTGAPRGSIRRYLSSILHFCRTFGRRDCRSMVDAVEETEREVWDILDAGPRHSFTCEGLLVHNCARFFEACESFFDLGADELDDGKKREKKTKPKAEAEPMKCPQCRALHRPSPVCPCCGHQYPKRETVRHIPGTLKELVAGGYRKELSEKIWPQVCGYVRERRTDDSGRRQALAIFKEITGAWPLTDWEHTQSIPPSAEVRNKIRANQIRYSKGRAKAQQRVHESSTESHMHDLARAFGMEGVR